MTRLLAKSVASLQSIPQSATLPGHLTDVGTSAEAIVDAVGAKMLHAVGLHPDDWGERLRKTLLLAAWLHDIGKANNQFQSAVQHAAAKNERQAIRHEWISLWIATSPEMKQWLLPAVDGCEPSWSIAMFAIAGHHPKLNRSVPNDEQFGAKPITIASDHPDFQKCLDAIQEALGLPQPPPNVPNAFYAGAGDQNAQDEFADRVKTLRQAWRRIRRTRNADWKRFCSIIKATLIASDVAGSALWEQIETVEQRQDWIRTSLLRAPSQNDLDGIVEQRLHRHRPRKFQQQIADASADVTLVEAGCGSGKTIAAYMWAARQHAGRRLWFCYPTTGTATEGYRDYLFDKLPQASDSQAKLFHSRADYDLKMMLEANDQTEDPDDTGVRVASLAAWDTQIVACTVDTVLCLLQNQRRGIYAWPALAHSAIVFDEIHCYDDKLFGNLLTWLEHLVGIPVLLMTASLPAAKREAIRNVVTKAQRTFQHIPHGPPELENLKRYQIANLPMGETSVEDCIELVRDEIQDNKGRVLWISNTVNQTREIGQRIDEIDQPLQSVVYHSRFVYTDRLNRHTEVVDLFSSDRKPGLASTSQVAEMSLDLAYATLLVTELAPIPALIQRLGRLNRRAAPDGAEPVIRTFIVIEPIRNGKIVSAPYQEEQLDLARRWLKELGDRPLSQADLIAHWHQLETTSPIDPEPSGWLEGGLETPVDAIRGSSYGITVICQQHLELAKRNGAAPYTLPMDRPKREHWQVSQYRFRGFPIASDEAIEYSPKMGGKWATHNVF